MSKVLIIGCGGVASVAIHKCCQVPEVFTEICIASRTKSKCDKLAAELAPKTTTNITTAQVDADHVDEVIALIKSLPARPRDEHRPALSGPDHHGRLPRLRRQLHGHRQLRAGEHRRPRVARHLREALQGGRLLRLLRLQLAVGLRQKV